MKPQKVSPTRNFIVSFISSLGGYITEEVDFSNAAYGRIFEGADGIQYYALTEIEYLLASACFYRSLKKPVEDVG